MQLSNSIGRRQFLYGAGAALGSLSCLPGFSRICTANQKDASGKIYPVKLAVKYGMIRAGKTPQEKFALIKQLGYEGVEMDSPSDVDRDAAVRARDETGIVIHGVVDSIHWEKRLSDPDPAVRAAASPAGSRGPISSTSIRAATCTSRAGTGAG